MQCKSYSHFFSKNISVYAISNEQSFNATLTDDIVSFEQLGPDWFQGIGNGTGYKIYRFCLGLAQNLPGVSSPLKYFDHHENIPI